MSISSQDVPKGIHFDMMDNSYAITVGDKPDGMASLRVLIEDCPGHWSWVSPFTVDAIDGKGVKLEMVNELVEMKRLSLSQ